MHLHCSRERGRGEPNCQVISIKRAATERRQRSRKIIDENKEKYTVKNRSLQKTLPDLNKLTFLILKNHASAPTKKVRLSPVSKACQNKFVKNGKMPHRFNNLKEVNGSKNCPRARLGFFKPKWTEKETELDQE